jgi:uncharacterized membrane protein
MAGLLSNFRATLVVSFILALVMVFAYYVHGQSDPTVFGQAVLRWLHVLSGILWIGLLYYFNFVQIRVTPQIPAELRPAVSKHITPEALFWFRWAAFATWVCGVALAYERGFIDAYAFGYDKGFPPQLVLLGTGMWLATLMFLFVWGVIWPNQKTALGLRKKEASAERKAKAARTAMLFSRTNLLLSIPMLVVMTMSQTIFG